MKKKEFLLFLLSTSVFVVYGFDTKIEILYKNVREIFSEDSKDLTYDEGDEVEITFTAPSITGRQAFMTLSFLKGGVSTQLMEDDNLMIYHAILTKDLDDGYLVCDIKTEDNETKQLKVHFKRNATESEQNAQFSGNLFKIVLISLGAFIGTSIFLMVIVAIYNRFKRNSGSNRSSYPIYNDIIPMTKTSETSKEETKLNVQDDNNAAQNGYVATPNIPINSSHIGKPLE